jgi:hypothetical protein
VEAQLSSILVAVEAQLSSILSALEAQLSSILAAMEERRWEANLNHLGCSEIRPTGLTHPSAPASKPSNPFFPSSY